MRFLKKSPPPSRRTIAASRREELARRADEEAAAMPPAAAYRRNVTLNSRQAESPAQTSERLLAHEQTDRRRRLAKHLTGAGAGVLLVLYVLFQLALGVSVKTPNTIRAEDAARYKLVLEEYYQARPVERLRFFLNSEEVKQFFAAKTPEVKTVRVDPSGLTRAELKLTFRQPVAEWTSGETTHFVDDDGITFNKNYFKAPNVVVQDQSGIPATSGQEVVNRRFLSFLGQAVASFGRYQLTVTRVTVPPETVRQALFSIEGRRSAIKMSIDRAVQPQVEQAVRALSALDARAVSPEYIDVRVDQRVFYR